MRLYLDLETVGLKLAKHGIIAIGGVIEDNNGEVVDTFQVELDPLSYTPEIDDEALKYNGYTREQMQGFQPAPLAVAELITILREHLVDRFTIVGYNSDAFDIPRLKKLFIATGNRGVFNELFAYKTIDIFKVVLWLDSVGIMPKTANHKLPTLTRYFKIGHEAHNAVSDCLATRELNYKLKELKCLK